MTEKQLNELLLDMSLKEKIGQLLQLDGSFFEEGTTVTGPGSKLGFIEDDLILCGSVLNIHGADVTKRLQQKAIQQQPHHIPLLFMFDIINGYRTIFPIPLAQGCTFDEKMVEKAAGISAKESAAAGLHLTFSPMADLVRDPRWGRVMESTGEDKYLNSILSAAMVRGYQGDDLSQKGKIAACVKHFAAYGMPTGGREYNNVELCERTLKEEYLPAYEASIKAGAASVMASFNPIDRIPATANSHLLRDVLRGEMGFDGVLISDYAAVKELIAHTIAENDREAAELAITAGIDIDMMSCVYVRELENLIKSGSVAEELIDQAVLRILRLKNKLGLFEHPYKDVSTEDEKSMILCKEHRETAREMSCDSFVLLKNEEKALPLTANAGRIAFIGPYVESKRIFGAWSMLGREEDCVSIKEAVEQRNEQILFAKGCGVLPAESELFGLGSAFCEQMTKKDEQLLLDEAVKIAGKADTVVLCLGEHPHQTGEGGSYADLGLPLQQKRLLEAVHKVNNNIILVLFSGRPMEIREECDKLKSVLMVWFPGTEGGNAIADVLFGCEQPGGRLAMSIPYSVGQIPVFYSEFTTGRPYREDISCKRFVSHYQDIPNAALYPFGFGLSYTTLSYSQVKLDHELLERGQYITASVFVTNTGDREGTETVQLYIRDLAGSVIRPIKELKGIKKVKLAPGERKEVCFQITEDMLKFYDKSGKFTAEAGAFWVFIGADSSTKNSAEFRFE